MAFLLLKCETCLKLAVLMTNEMKLCCDTFCPRSVNSDEEVAIKIDQYPMTILNARVNTAGHVRSLSSEEYEIQYTRALQYQVSYS